MATEKKGDVTKKKIEKAAIEQFSIHGFQKTSYEMLASASGLTRANIQYHFPKKEDLFLSCVHRVAKENHAYLSEKVRLDLGAREKLEAHFVENLRWFLLHRDQAQIILGFYYLACVDERFSRACQSVLNTGMTRILEYVLLGLRTGHFLVASESLEKTAETLHDALVGGIIRSVTYSSRNDSETTIEREIASAREKWRRLFDEVLRPTPSP